MSDLYMIGAIWQGEIFHMLGVADSEEAAKDFVQDYLKEHDTNPPEPGELAWQMTSRDNFESLLYLTSWDDWNISIKTTGLITSAAPS